jgi:hypothetical protein
MVIGASPLDIVETMECDVLVNTSSVRSLERDVCVDPDPAHTSFGHPAVEFPDTPLTQGETR